ncbi:dipeptide ABC transporter ATP-binding protein [Egibacter rhizosphaerae]|uniref:Dipeptide ABC transporter ATP-binding protein n=1 Tax=Egibacter rhizosphaerae TaxID=1670831 RepID=A0A411YKK9_9ACTN|nr:dipeptide ABC transporter ATP-binding protein [Egibacter rhizosphaerae]QBI21749.1 dipeptide ABC transporter ATP-binding protein [Egibacter rhizosphaerae]
MTLDLGGSQPLLSVRGLTKHFPLTRGIVFRRQVGTVRAVDGVSFDLAPGETLGLVGESGCGKSTTARVLLRLIEPTSGEAHYRGTDIFRMSTRELRRMRRDVQIIFQDPYASLDPRMTVGKIIGEGWEIHPDVVPRNRRKQEIGDLLERVGLERSHADRFPHQFSGGQRQRIGIARALALRPEVLLLDEPVSALDVSVQAQVINLLEELQADYGFAALFIAHDLSVVRHISDRVAVMYLGRIVETGDSDEIYERPTHPYTQALLSAVPSPDPTVTRRERIRLEGDVPSPANPPSGCSFRTRCWKADSRCAEEDPELIDRFGHGHPSACHYAELADVLGTTDRR